jgi:glycosyltransferase involved in cell wall biosynthesis
MKVAFVSQAIDSVLPPFQNSVGACTYGSACAMAKTSEVIVYGLKETNDGHSALTQRGVKFRFIPSAATDELIYRARTKLSRAVKLQPVSTSPLLYPNYGLQVARDLSKEKFDVIHIQHSSQYIPIIRKLNPEAKIVLHLHAEWFSQCKPAQLLRRLKGLDMLTTVSDYATDQVSRLLPNLALPCITHYNGFDPAEFSRERDYAAVAQRAEKRILFAGGVSPHKGIHILIDAFKLVAAQVPDVRLNLSGPQGTYPIEETFDAINDRALIEELAPFYTKSGVSFVRKLLGSGSAVAPDYIAQLKAKLPSELMSKVLFLGKIPREDLVDHYHETDLFVFPSLFAEGFGLPPVEAMAAGAPVIGTHSGAIAETIQHGVTGLLVEKNDPRALADAMLAVLGNASMREQMGRAGRRRALEHFTWDHVTKKMFSSYEALCSGDLDKKHGSAQPHARPMAL